MIRVRSVSLLFLKNTIFRKYFDIAKDLKVSREVILEPLETEKDKDVTLGCNKIILN